MPTPPPTLIFDLDGTLTDSAPGILGCLRKVIDAHNLDDPGSLQRFLGPPVEQWVAELLPHADAAARTAFADAYRACYDREGWTNNSLYPGVSEMLARLQESKVPLFVCTSKRQDFADRILNHFGLSSRFVAIYGDRAEFPTHSKTDLLRRLLRDRSLSPENTWMVGDRIFDMDAARANRIRSIAAAWGYGVPQEHAQADATASIPADVPEIVLG